MKKSSDLLKNLHHTISSCSKKNRKMFEDELEEMSRKIQEMIKREFVSPTLTVDFKPLEDLNKKIEALQQNISKAVSILSCEAGKAIKEIMQDFQALEGLKTEIVNRSLKNLTETEKAREKVLKSLKQDRNLIKQSIKRYKWIDL
ncbi:hypothetical protein NGRA_0545 [Nosema granulosis]|uniref:Uncharacterized protein n=1 Tax=Nosema granulosis TaxID=83296 RepID=A0A9P6H0R0_9MICR|nr:hypothetical protein NGRA_0545 [Nosema granulosis]